MNNSKISNLILRYGLALTFIFSGYTLIAQPESWASYVPEWFIRILPIDVLTSIQFMGFVEILLAIAFITGLYLRPAAFVAAIEVVGILLLGGLDAVDFKDIVVFAGSLAIFFGSFAPKINQTSSSISASEPAASAPTAEEQAKKLTDSQKRLRIILVSAAFLLFSIILVGLFWLSNTTKDQAGWLAFSYATGLSMIVLPCTLPLAFVIVPLAMGKDAKKGLAIAFAFALGVTITLSLYGALIAKLGQVVGLDRAKDTMYLIAGAFAVIFGFGELGLIKMRVPTYSGAFPAFIQNRKDAFKGLLLGLLLGNVGLGCPNPAFYVLLSHIATVGSMSTGWFLTFIHAIGRVTPLLLLAILAVLGVDALSVLMKRREALTRATAWGVVGVGAFILCFGLLGHDWYVYSGIHSLLEKVTQEAAFMTQYANQFGGIAHSHELPSGKYLPYGSWLMVTLIAIPMIWNWRRKKSEVISDNPESARAYKWFGAYTIASVICLYLLFPIALQNWYVYKVSQSHHGAMSSGDHAHAEGTPDNHAHGTVDPATLPVSILLETTERPVRDGKLVSLTFTVLEKSTNQILNNLEISHGEPMHVVGVRKDDLDEFFHVHPDVEGNKFVVTHLFPEDGVYAIWPGIVYKGEHINMQMPLLTVGDPATASLEPQVFERTQRMENNLVVNMKAAPKLYAGTLHNIGFAVTDAGGFDIPLGKYLEENAHINIISSTIGHYHHLHTNYGMIGEDSHGGGGAHDHGSIPSSISIKPSSFSVVPVAYAQSSDGHTDHSHGPVETGEDQITFNEKDLRIRFAFPEPGTYKIFFEFVTAANPNLTQRAEFWVNVEAPLPAAGIKLPKWLLTVISIILIAAVMPLIFRYLNEERIKV